MSNKVIWSALNAEDTAADARLPYVDDGNITPDVKLRVKKSNGNIVTADILDKFVGEKVDADTISDLLVAKAPLAKTVENDKVVLESTAESVVQVVTYGATGWNDIDFTKQLLLRYIVHDTVVSSAAYTATATALKFYVDIENEVYVVQLLHDTNEWTATKVDSSSVYEAPWGLPLQLLNTIQPDVLVYTKKDDAAVYMNSYRSTTGGWRFTQIDGDLIHEAVVTPQGWTEKTHSIGGGTYTPGAGIDITNNTISLKYTVKEI